MDNPSAMIPGSVDHHTAHGLEDDIDSIMGKADHVPSAPEEQPASDHNDDGCKDEKNVTMSNKTQKDMAVSSCPEFSSSAKGDIKASDDTESGAEKDAVEFTQQKTGALRNATDEITAGPKDEGNQEPILDQPKNSAPVASTTGNETETTTSEAIRGKEEIPVDEEEVVLVQAAHEKETENSETENAAATESSQMKAVTNQDGTIRDSDVKDSATAESPAFSSPEAELEGVNGGKSPVESLPKDAPDEIQEIPSAAGPTSDESSPSSEITTQDTMVQNAKIESMTDIGVEAAAVSVEKTNSVPSVPSSGAEANEVSEKSIEISEESKSPEPEQKSQGEKMKFEVVNADGKFTLKVTNSSKTDSDGSESTSPISPVSPATPRKKGRDKARMSKVMSPNKSKSTGGKARNKVMSPKSPMPGQPLSAPQKPLMDLRHILKKHEKKTEPVQPIQQVDFYGSMSAIPFLKANRSEDKKTATEQKKKVKPKTRASTNSKQESSSGDSPTSKPIVVEDEPSEELMPEKPSLPSKEEIVMTAEYDEDQLNLWKSMSALDGRQDSVERPQELLPLRPGIRQPKKKAPPTEHAVRAFSRPDDWLNRPASISPVKKSYRVGITKEDMEGQVLVMEPEDHTKG